KSISKPKAKAETKKANTFDDAVLPRTSPLPGNKGRLKHTKPPSAKYISKQLSRQMTAENIKDVTISNTNIAPPKEVRPLTVPQTPAFMKRQRIRKAVQVVTDVLIEVCSFM